MSHFKQACDLMKGVWWVGEPRREHEQGDPFIIITFRPKNHRGDTRRKWNGAGEIGGGGKKQAPQNKHQTEGGMRTGGVGVGGVGRLSLSSSAVLEIKPTSISLGRRRWGEEG